MRASPKDGFDVAKRRWGIRRMIAQRSRRGGTNPLLLRHSTRSAKLLLLMAGNELSEMPDLPERLQRVDVATEDANFDFGNKFRFISYV